MKMFKKVIISVCFVFITGNAIADSSRIAFPSDYREWFHVKSMLIEDGHPLANPFKGLHHVYANDIALKGLKEGHYKNGSVFVFDLLSHKSENKTVQESSRKFIGVMQKNTQNFNTTGGWGFEVFLGDSRNNRQVKDKGQSCFACHASQEKNGYVFSALRK